MLITAAVGMSLVPVQRINLVYSTLSLIGIGLHACASGILNQLFEQDIDQIMSRTKNRPLVNERITRKHAISLVIIFLLLGSIILYTFSNTLTLSLTLFTMLGYSYIYTKLLKPNTSQNIVIGGLFGAMPPLLGWTALTGSLHTLPVLLVAIIFTWTPSHFWALSLAKIDDYRKSPLPMLPVTHGIKCTQVHILGYCILLILITQLPYLLTYFGQIYLIIVNIANILLLRSMFLVYQEATPKRCWQAFKHSNIYLLCIFLTMLIDYQL